jgi:general secretion pathway protein L
MPADRASAIRAPYGAWREFARSSGLAGFLAWWAGELAPLVPKSTRAAVRRRRLRPVLAFERDELTLWQPVAQDGGIAMRAMGSVGLAGDPAELQAAGRALVDRIPRKVYGGAVSAPRVTLALPPRQVLRRTVTLPAAIEENLRQALAYDLDRHTPFRADELYFDAAVVGRDPASGTIRVELAAARRAVVDQAIQVAESLGANVGGVSPEEPSRAADSRLSLVPDARRAERSAGQRWRFWVPFGLLLAAALAAAAIPIVQKRQYAIALHQHVDEARSRAAVSEGLRNELDRLAADYNFALERKFAYPPTLVVLEEVTRLLPDDTWLTQMEVKSNARGKESQRELLLRGESANAGRLITLFEESKVFAQAAPRSPTTKIQPGPGEIFDLAAQLRTLPMPGPINLAASAPAQATPPASPPLPPASQASTTPARASASRPEAGAPAAPAAPAAATDSPYNQANAAPGSGPAIMLPPGVTPAPETAAPPAGAAAPPEGGARPAQPRRPNRDT